jgi:hypothetical protein
MFVTQWSAYTSLRPAARCPFLVRALSPPQCRLPEVTLVGSESAVYAVPTMNRCIPISFRLGATSASRRSADLSSAVPPRSCLVTLTDSRGIKHSVEVTADSLFEAGVLAVNALRQAGWVEEVPGPASRLEIEVREPAVKHTVTLAQLERWANGATKSPVERIRRERMRELLGQHDADDGLRRRPDERR